jgi:hypothetical protein
MSFGINIETAFLLLGVTVILAVFNTVWHALTAKKIRGLLAGTNAQNFEEAGALIRKEIEELKNFRKESETYFERVEKRLQRSVQGVETIRFNPFKGTGDGGNQSFATAFVDERGNGAVISSLYTREKVSVFSKPVQKFSSEFELTEEEKDAINNTQKKLAGRS